MNKSCSDKNTLKALRFYQNDGVTEKLQSDEVLWQWFWNKSCNFANKSCHSRSYASIPNDWTHSGHQIVVICSSTRMPAFVIARFHVIGTIFILWFFWIKVATVACLNEIYTWLKWWPSKNSVNKSCYMYSAFKRMSGHCLTPSEHGEPSPGKFCKNPKKKFFFREFEQRERSFFKW